MPNYLAADSLFVDSTTKNVRGDPNLSVSVISRFLSFSASKDV